MQEPTPDEREEADPLEQDVCECLELLCSRGEAGLEEWLAAHPERARDVASRVAALRRMGLVDGPPADEFPERLGEFRLLEPLGRGGMGIVYRARQESLEREVALKLIRPEQLYFPGSRERFRREVLAVARLRHPGIVPVYSVGEEGGVPYFAMELVDGCSLAEALTALEGQNPAQLSGVDLVRVIERSGRPGSDPEAAASASAGLFDGSWSDACVRLVRQVAEALEHAHGRAILHRDVKPSNIVVTRTGRALLLDFGLASTDDAGDLTRTGSQPGSLPYMSPEQLDGARDLDARTDVYSLGTVLYELLTLQRAFDPESSSAQAVRQAIAAGRIERPRRHSSAISRDVETVCLKAMSCEREQRYASAADLARDLGNLLAHRPIEARRPGLVVRGALWSQRNPALSGVLMIAAVLALGAATLLSRQQSLHARELETEKQTAEQVSARLAELSTEFLFEFHESIRHLPGTLPARRKLVTKARDLFEELAQAAQSDPELRARLADAHYRLGDVLGAPSMPSLGDTESALVEYAEAERLWQLVRDELPAAHPRLANRVLCCLQRGTLELNAGNLEAAATAFEQGFELAGELEAAGAGNLSLANTHAQLLLNFADLVQKRGEGARAIELSREAVALLEEFGATSADPEARTLLEQTTASLAVLLTRAGDSAGAFELRVKVLGFSQEYAAEHPDEIESQLFLVQSLITLAASAYELKRFDEAEQLMGEGLELAERLVRDDPDNALALMLLQAACQGAGTMELDRGSHDLARDLLDRALELGEDPRIARDRRVRETTASSWMGLGDVSHARGDLDGAFEAWERSREMYEQMRAEAPDDPFPGRQLELLDQRVERLD